MTGSEYQYKNRFNGCVRLVRVVHSREASSGWYAESYTVDWSKTRLISPIIGKYVNTYPEAFEFFIKISNTYFRDHPDISLYYGFVSSIKRNNSR